VTDDPAPLLGRAREEARDVDERHERDVEGVAGPHEPGRLDRGVDVEHACERGRLVPDDPDRVAAEAREAADDVLRVERLQLEERTVVDDGLDHALDVVRLVRGVRDQRVELGRLTVGRVRRRGVRRRLEVVLRQERQQVSGVVDACALVRSDEMGDPGLRRVRRRAAEILERDVLPGDRLHDVGAGDEHVGRALGHQDEVGDRGRVDGATGAGPHDQRDLRHHPGGLHVPPEDLRVTGERDDALLDPRAPRVVDPDHGTADLDGHVHHLADLLGEDLGERPAEHREVLAEHADRPAEHRPEAGHDRVAPRPVVVHPELDLAVTDEAVELDERAGIEQEVEPLACEELPALVLARDGLLRARVRRLLRKLPQPGELLCGRLVAGRHPCGA
jgi:hypothetical protein